MSLNTVQRDLRAYNVALNEAVNVAQNHPLWRLRRMVLHTPVAYTRKEEEDAILGR